MSKPVFWDTVCSNVELGQPGAGSQIWKGATRLRLSHSSNLVIDQGVAFVNAYHNHTALLPGTQAMTTPLWSPAFRLTQPSKSLSPRRCACVCARRKGLEGRCTTGLASRQNQTCVCNAAVPGSGSARETSGIQRCFHSLCAVTLYDAGSTIQCCCKRLDGRGFRSFSSQASLNRFFLNCWIAVVG